MSAVLTATGDLSRLVVRNLRRELRILDGLIVNTALPVIIMVLFVYVFGGAITTGSSGLAYIDFVVPAVLLMSGGYGAALTAVNIADDMTAGMIDRFRTLPIGGWVVPTGHVVASVVRNVAASGFALLAAVIMGFRPNATPADWALVLAVVTGYVLAMSSLAVLWGLLVTSAQAAARSASSCSSCRTCRTGSYRPRPCRTCCATSPTTSRPRRSWRRSGRCSWTSRWARPGRWRRPGSRARCWSARRSRHCCSAAGPPPRGAGPLLAAGNSNDRHQTRRRTGRVLPARDHGRARPGISTRPVANPTGSP
ncbi:ABC transporter permease [Streptosporangium lutulentum]